MSFKLNICNDRIDSNLKGPTNSRKVAPFTVNLIEWIGSVPEWLMGADCKSAGYAYVGSNPTRPIISTSPCSSAVEHSLGKGEVSGSSPDEGMSLNRSQGKQSKALKIAKKLLKPQNINQLEQKLEPKGSFLLYSHIPNHINDFTHFFPYTQVIINKN